MENNNQSKKVLIIEDDESLREMYVTKLKIAGFEVETAENGDEGLEKMRKGKPNLALLDIMMPKKNGFDVLEEVQKDESIKDIPIIILSNLGQESDMTLAKSLGARDYIIKSQIMLNDLVKKINHYMPA